MKTALLIAGFAFVALVIFMWRSSPAAAQTQEERAACGADAMKFCQTELTQSPSTVLSCLQRHRRQISKECVAVLAARGK